MNGTQRRSPFLCTLARRVSLAVIGLVACGCQGNIGEGLRVLSFDPGTGSASGGEVVTITGRGFAGASDVFFAERASPAVQVIAGGTVIEAVTPPGIAGFVAVLVESRGLAAVAPEAFTLEPLDVSYDDYTSAFPDDDLDSRGATLADLDGDGDLDVVIAVRNAPNRLLVNDGSGNFVLGDGLPETIESLDAGEPPVLLAEDSLDIAAGDLDADGDLDLYVSNYGETADRLYLNRGDGSFTDASGLLPDVATASHSASIDDIDGDGDLDVVVAVNGMNRVVRNLLEHGGVLAFEEATDALPAHPDNTIRIGIGDLDLDGDLDLVTANEQDGSTIRLYLNDGTGRFDAAPAGQLPVTSPGCREVVVVDLTGDGAPDLFAVNVEQNRLYVNNGDGFFFDDTVRAVPYDMVFSSSAVIFDADLDGDLDVAIANRGAANRLYLNDGSGVLRDYTVLLPEDLDSSMDVLAGDLDGDGDTDLVFSNDAGERDTLYLLEPQRSDP